jgi:hypothetical protein
VMVPITIVISVSRMFVTIDTSYGLTNGYFMFILYAVSAEWLPIHLSVEAVVGLDIL